MKRKPKASFPEVDEALVHSLGDLLKRTFSPVKSVKRDLLILLLADVAPAFVATAPNGTTDGAAGSALLTELILQLGMDVDANRENLKRALVMGFYSARMPIRQLSDAAHCVSLRSTGAPLVGAAVLEQTFWKIPLPSDILEHIMSFTGTDLWWGRSKALELPRVTPDFRAYSIFCPPGPVRRLLQSVAYFDVTLLSFSTDDLIWIAWAGDVLNLRCKTSIRPLVVLLRRERRFLTTFRSAAVIRVGGLGDVLL